MGEPSLFDDAFKEGNEGQSHQIERVGHRIGRYIVEFCHGRMLQRQYQFHANDLRQFVEGRFPSAPGSSDRILRDLRQKGQLNYVIINRRDSLYELLSVGDLGRENEINLNRD